MAKPSGNNSLPNWNGTDQAVPGASKRNIGWTTGERPPAGMFNWFWKTVSLWLTYFNNWTTNHNHEGLSSDGSSKKIKLDKELDMTVAGTGTGLATFKVITNTAAAHDVAYKHTGTGLTTFTADTLIGDYKVQAKSLSVLDGNIDFQPGGTLDIYKDTVFYQGANFDRIAVSNAAIFASPVQVSQGVNYGSAASRVEVRSSMSGTQARELDFKVGGTDPGTGNNVQLKAGSLRLKTKSPAPTATGLAETLYKDNLVKAACQIVFAQETLSQLPYVESFSGYNIEKIERCDKNHNPVLISEPAVGWKVTFKDPIVANTFVVSPVFKIDTTSEINPIAGMISARADGVIKLTGGMVQHVIISATILSPALTPGSTLTGAAFKNLPNTQNAMTRPFELHFTAV